MVFVWKIFISNFMKKISPESFHTNADMLDKDVLRYCENFYQYLFHITNFFGETLNSSEFHWLSFLVQRINFFLDGAPATDKYVSIVGRYKRLLPKLNRILNEQTSKYNSAE